MTLAASAVLWRICSYQIGSFALQHIARKVRQTRAFAACQSDVAAVQGCSVEPEIDKSVVSILNLSLGCFTRVRAVGDPTMSYA